MTHSNVASDCLYDFPSQEEENRELASVLTQINRAKPVTVRDVRCARMKHGRLFTREMFAKQVSTRFGIVSFAANPRHPLMWSHYTTDGSGFVIGYEVEALRKKARHESWLRPVTYGDSLPPLYAPKVLAAPESNILALLSAKSTHWSYEDEWRLIVELSRTIGIGESDLHGQPINLVQIPNETIVSVYYTERTPANTVQLIRERITDKNNRYSVENLSKLVLSSTSYRYEEGH